MKVGAVNGDDHKSLGGKYNIRGFPTIKIFSKGHTNPEDYNGPRTAADIVDAALSAASQKVRGVLGGKKGGRSKVNKYIIILNIELKS